MSRKKSSEKNKKYAKLAKITTSSTFLVLLQIIKWLIIAGLVSGFLVFGVLLGYVTSFLHDEQVRPVADMVEAIQQDSITGYVYFNDGKQIGQLRSEIDLQPISNLNKEVPQHIIDALVAVEDKNFYSHFGIDLVGTLRAVKQKLLNEDVQTGGSTLTQQVARRVFLSAEFSESGSFERTDRRKFKEMFLAMRMERFLSKDQIMMAYLNKMPFGTGSTGYNLYGIKAAARGIFAIEDLHELNIAQAAYLAGLPQLPTTYSAFKSSGEFNEKGFNNAVDRQELVLLRMMEEGKITDAQYEEALSFDLRASLAESNQKAYNTHPFLMLEVERRAAEILVSQTYPGLTQQERSDAKYQEMIENVQDQLLNGGYHIHTTIDETIYEALQEISRNPENFSPDDKTKGVEQIGGIVINNNTGEILAMLEGRDFHIEQLNHATQMVRPPGSAMKPIAAFLPALEEGKVQPGSIIDDVPLILPDGSKGFHIPNNHDGKYHGLITARHALNQSYNIPAIKLFKDAVTIPKAWEFTKKLGITTLTEKDNNALTGVIGGLEYGTTVEELANAYAAIGNQGVFNDAYLISKITDSEGRVIYEHQANPARVFSEETAYLMTDMLRTVVENGTGIGVKNAFKHYDKTAIVGKTGTTQNDFDVWFMGYSPDITVGVWAGYDQPARLSTDGKRRAWKTWSSIMNKTIELKPELFPSKSFTKPDNIVSRTVSSASGKLPNELATESGRVITDIFNRKWIPIEEDDVLMRMDVIQYQGLNYIPHQETPTDFTTNKIVVKRNPPVASIMQQIRDLFANTAADKLPQRNGRTLTPEYYIPGDAEFDAPIEVDPRVDDGNIPPVPSQVSLNRDTSTGVVTITFNGINSGDLLGYRIYKSSNGHVYQRVYNIPAGEQLTYSDKVYNPNTATYYITAVDVAGNESAASNVVFSHDNAFDPGLFMNDNPGSSENGDVPEQPDNVKLMKNESNTGVVISWNANPASDNITEYQIYYNIQENGPYTRIGITDGTSFVHLSIPVKGWYYIVAVNSTGKSAPSSPIQIE